MRQDGDFEVVFVDNASTDNTPNVLVQVCASSIKPCKVSRLNRNYRWRRGNNRGALIARNVDYFLFLNDDVILAPNALKKLIKFIKSNSNVGVLQPAIKNRDVSILYGFGVGIGGMCKPIIKPRGYPFSEASYVSCAALLTPLELFFRVGMFPEKFFFCIMMMLTTAGGLEGLVIELAH